MPLIFTATDWPPSATANGPLPTTYPPLSHRPPRHTAALARHRPRLRCPRPQLRAPRCAKSGPAFGRSRPRPYPGPAAPPPSPLIGHGGLHGEGDGRCEGCLSCRLGHRQSLRFGVEPLGLRRDRLRLLGLRPGRFLRECRHRDQYGQRKDRQPALYPWRPCRPPQPSRPPRHHRPPPLPSIDHPSSSRLPSRRLPERPGSQRWRRWRSLRRAS